MSVPSELSLMYSSVPRLKNSRSVSTPWDSNSGSARAPLQADVAVPKKELELSIIVVIIFSIFNVISPRFVFVNARRAKTRTTIDLCELHVYYFIYSWFLQLKRSFQWFHNLLSSWSITFLSRFWNISLSFTY